MQEYCDGQCIVTITLFYIILLKKLILRHKLNEFKRTAAAQFQMQAASEPHGPEDPSN